MDTALIDSPTTTDAQAPSAPAPETTAPEASGSPASSGQQPSPASSAPATPNSADRFDGVSPEVLFNHIRALEQRLQAIQTPAPATQPAQPQSAQSDFDALLAKAKEDGEFGDGGLKLVEQLVGTIKTMQQGAAKPADAQQPGSPLPSIEQVVAQAKTQAMVDRWYADAAAKNPEMAALYGTSDTRQNNPILQMQARQHLEISGVVQAIANQFGFKCPEGKCLDLGHEILQVLSGKRESLTPAAAVQQVRDAMVARNNQRTVPPSASSTGAGQDRPMTREDAIANIMAMGRR